MARLLNSWTALMVAVVAACWFPRDAPAAAGVQFDYRVNVAGRAEDKLLEQIQEASRLFELVDRPPASFSALEKRAKNDLTRIRKVLRSEGYYGARVEYDIDASKEPISVILNIEQGDIYLLEKPAVVLEKPPPEAMRVKYTLASLGLAGDTPARAVTVVSAENAIVASLEARGFPMAVAGEREVIVDHATKTVGVTFRIVPGPYARFGELTVEGLHNVDAGYVDRRIKWLRGEQYDSTLVQATQRALSQSRLFASVRIVHADAVNEEGRIAMHIIAEEAKQRVIGAGIGYSTDEGIGARGFWEHRNLFGAAEHLRLELGGSSIRNGASAEYVLPDFFSANQSFISTAAITQEDTEAFESETIETSFSIERPLTAFLAGRAGVSIERSFIVEDDIEDRFILVGVPLQLRWGRTDDALDPTRGARVNLTATPFLESLGSDLSFVSAQLRPSAYFLLEESHRAVLGTWGGVGTILGVATDDLPADKRFYAGGGSSIRGYGFQLVGPLDGSNDPLGGRSVLQLGAELRARVYGDFGGAIFLEAGNVFDNTVPDFEDPLLLGAGFGIRYFTGLGPIRFDMGFPLDRRGGVDDPFQIYVSFGQAF